MSWLATNIIGGLLLPPASLLLLALIGWMIAPRRPALGSILVAFSWLSLVLLSMPIVGRQLLHSLEPYPALTAPKASQADAIVVLGGGIHFEATEYGGDTVKYFSLERLRYAAKLQRLTGLPLLATGGRPEGGAAEADLIAKVLTDEFRIPVRWRETQSNTTAENARFSARILLPLKKQRILLISHAWHMPRAVAAFEAAGFDVIPAPTMFTTHRQTTPLDFIPSAGGLQRSYYALHEWIGIAWYWVGDKI